MITYLKGDVTNPIGDGNKIIPHVCNDINMMGAGVAFALAKKWSKVKSEYHEQKEFCSVLGNVLFVPVEDDIMIANMIGQHQCWSENGIPPIRYNALRTALQKVNEWAVLNHATVHAPKFGSDLAGGDWDIIEQIINETISVDVYIYIFK